METLAKNSAIEILNEVVIAGGYQERQRAMNPAVAVAQNGDVLTAYVEGSDHHITPDGVLMVARSTDGGLTWPEKKAVVAEPGWDCFTNHAIGCLPDGSLLLHVIRRRNFPGPDGRNRPECRGSWTRSRDGGRTWEPCGPVLQTPMISNRGNSCCYGRIEGLSDGRLMVPFYGVPQGAREDSRLRALAVAFSADEGYSWPEFTMVYEDRKGDVNPSETDLLQLPDGRHLLMIRANAARQLVRSYSSDEGRTWTPIEPTELPGQCPALIYLTSGEILCAYRDMRPEQPGMSCAVSSDLGETWTPLGYLYRGANFDCAYPSMVHLPAGYIYCVFYTAGDPEPMTGTCEIHGLLLRDMTAP